ncbi:hypothetical protein V2J09_004946 [Rumex salicifolius]
MEELRSQATEQSRATSAIRDELGGKLASLESMITALVNQSAANNTTPVPSTSPSDPTPPLTDAIDETLTPDLPDLTRGGAVINGRPQPAANHPSLLPNGMVTRLSKIEFPKFDGSLLREWIYRCEQFFMLDSTPPELKVRLASLHMEGRALQWHHNFISTRYGVFPSWPEYIVAVSARFAELVDDPLSELVSLKQGSDSVDTYLDKFECTLTRLNLPIAHALSIFLTNLHPHLALQARQFNVTNISEAARIAKLHESALQLTPAKATRAPFNPYSRNQPQFTKLAPSAPLLPYPDPTKPTTIPFKAAVPFRQNTERPPRRFSYNEMQDRHFKGLCMFCDEAYTPEHRLKHRKSQIYVMECNDIGSDNEDSEPAVTEEPETDTVAAPPTISVNALNGSATFNCMRVVGQYAKRKLYILIDPGSTHNFLDLAVAKQLGCPLEPIKQMSVAAANGNSMLSSFRCKDFALRLQGYEFKTEVRTLPLDCCDLVLGIPWLTTLGPIWWDFSNLRMEFSVQGLKHVLRGVTKAGCKVITGGSLNKLLLQQPHVLFLQIRDVDELGNHTPADPTSLLTQISAPGKENVAADALSRVTGSQLLAITISHACHDLFDSIQLLWQSDPSLRRLISDLSADPSSHPAYSYSNSELRYKNKLVVGNDPTIKLKILQWLHDSSTPYEIIYGQPPPLHLPYLPGESSSAIVDRSLRKREELLDMLKFHLQRAQNRQKQAADAHRSAREFQLPPRTDFSDLRFLGGTLGWIGTSSTPRRRSLSQCENNRESIKSINSEKFSISLTTK